MRMSIATLCTKTQQAASGGGGGGGLHQRWMGNAGQQSMYLWFIATMVQSIYLWCKVPLVQSVQSMNSAE